MRILLVEDDRKAARLLVRGLQEEGFVADVAPSAEIGEQLAEAGRYDAILLDWLLPGKKGLALCRDLRGKGISAPILMLTARDAVTDRVAGLDSGADDYLTKPFAFEELLARIRALLRRPAVSRPPLLQVADLTLDPATQRVARGDAEIELTRTEYAILEVLMRHAGEVVTRARIGNAVWETDSDRLANLVDVHVSHLRRKVDRPGSPPLILTVRGRGFRLEEAGNRCA